MKKTIRRACTHSARRLCALAIAATIASIPGVSPSHAKSVTIEALTETITPYTAPYLSGLACRNYDRIIHLNVSIDWPADKVDVEADGYQRLIFWTDGEEFLLPAGTFRYQHGVYLVNEYFIVRSGGTHQGVVSIAFERVDPAAVLLNPNVRETAVRNVGCW